MRRTIFAILVSVATVLTTLASPIVPAPKLYVKQAGTFTIAPTAAICYTAEELAPLANYLTEYIKVTKVCGKPKSGSIALEIDKSLAAEEYRLSVIADGVKIVAGGYGGAFNGVQSLLQLLPSEVYKKSLSLPATVECCKVEDAPRFSYRGFMLDVVRTFMTKENVLRYIDYISYHKINKLHWHLTDSQAWRLEIKSHPKLAQIGGYRGGDSPIHAQLGNYDEKYGGYYTQDDVREIIAYAAVRNVEIIPEIDLPGHSWAITKVYPKMLCKHMNGKPRRGGGVVCATNEDNYQIIEDIIAEVAALFPSKYIHIGGDEVKFKQWQTCPTCSAWLKDNNAKRPHELEEYFIKRVRDIVVKYGKTTMAWFFGGSVPQDVVVQGWQKTSQCKISAEKGCHTIVMPADSFYLDIYQGEYEPGFRSRKYFDVKRLYSYDLAKEGFTPEHMKYVDGFEAPFWSELFLLHGGDKSLDYIEYMTFPRLCGLAEQGWGKNGGAWENFYATLVNHHYDRMSAMGINYRLMPPTVKYEDGKLVASVDDKSTLYYKREGDAESKKYTTPVACKRPAEYISRSFSTQS